MDIDWRRNCYSCGEFRHLVRNYRNQEIMKQGKRLEYENNSNTINNLNREESLVTNFI